MRHRPCSKMQAEMNGANALRIFNILLISKIRNLPDTTAIDGINLVQLFLDRRSSPARRVPENVAPAGIHLRFCSKEANMTDRDNQRTIRCPSETSEQGHIKFDPNAQHCLDIVLLRQGMETFASWSHHHMVEA